MKLNRSDVFKTPTTQTFIKKPLLELNNSKDDESSSDEDNLPLNLNPDIEDEKVSKRKKKSLVYRETKKVERIISKIDSVNLDQSSESIEVEEEKSLKDRRKEKKKLKREYEKNQAEEVAKKKKKKKSSKIIDSDEEMINNESTSSKSEKVRIATPIRKKKKSKKNVNKLTQLIESSESKRLMEDDISMNESDIKKSIKRAKLIEADDEDNIDKLNSEHHLNLPFKHKPALIESLNFESSLRKEKKKMKNKKRDKEFSIKKWETKQAKKFEKTEMKKLKRLRNLERTEERKQLTKKELKKLAKKMLRDEVDKIEIDSLKFS